MKSYIFVLGRNPELSILELVSYFQKNNIEYKIKNQQKNFLLIFLNKKPDIKELAGTIKIAEIIESLNNLPLKNKLTYYTISQEINKKLKNIFKKEKIKAIFKQNFNSTKKLDLEILSINKKLALVTQVSNPKEYKLRDENRPNFDDKKVTSIRLAKILINLSQAKKEILDPFCGTGTILQEALLKNLKVIGMDKNIEEAKTNLDWLSKRYKTPTYKLIHGNSIFLSQQVKSVECVVTEPYLGPYLKKYPSPQEAKKIIDELEILYTKTLKEISKIVTDKIVIIVPIIKTRNSLVRFNFLNILKQANLKWISFKGVKQPILYKTRNNKVIREIWVLEKLK
ncbi:MAG: hypothetical protein KJ674_03615 [Nanoarchaeota archaeon]|nr:hypothetical protein [Nanoarchaeota archaeon]